MPLTRACCLAAQEKLQKQQKKRDEANAKAAAKRAAKGGNTDGGGAAAAGATFDMEDAPVRAPLPLINTHTRTHTCTRTHMPTRAACLIMRASIYIVHAPISTSTSCIHTPVEKNDFDPSL